MREGSKPGAHAQSGSPSALSVRDLGFSYSGKPVLDGVTFALGAGELVILLGANGAGKTTLFSLITRLYDHRQGHIQIGGHDLRRHSVQAHSQMGVIFQQPTLDLDLSVKQNLVYHAALHGMNRRVARQCATQQLDRVGLLASQNERVRHLSGGQRRRVEIARGLLHQPRLLLLDEPTVGLDIASRRALVEHVHQLCVDQGVAVLWATHLIDEVYPEDRVIILDKGRIRADGSVSDINAQQGTDTIGQAFDQLTAGEPQ